MEKVQIIDFGIAFKINNVIYLHKNLKNYPKLREALLKHEKKHTDNYKLKDILLDLTGGYLKDVKRDYYRFLFTEKKAWYQLLPLIRIRKKWIIDPLLSIIWTMLLIELVLIILAI